MGGSFAAIAIESHVVCSEGVNDDHENVRGTRDGRRQLGHGYPLPQPCGSFDAEKSQDRYRDYCRQRAMQEAQGIRCVLLKPAIIGYRYTSRKAQNCDWAEAAA